VFEASTQSWNSVKANRLNALQSKFAGMTLEEFEDFAWLVKPGRGWQLDASENANDMAAYLSAVQSGEITPNLTELTPEKAKELKMKGFSDACSAFVDSISFSFDGTEDFSGRVLTGGENCGLKYTGITGAQIAQCSQVLNYDLKNIKWTGKEDLSNVKFENVTGMQVPASVAATSKWESCTLGLVFSGSEDFSKAEFDGCEISGSTGSNVVKFAGTWKNSTIRLTFNGTEDFSKSYFENCSWYGSGLTEEQRQQIYARSDGTVFNY